jgi:hypothetical protein
MCSPPENKHRPVLASLLPGLNIHSVNEWMNEEPAWSSQETRLHTSWSLGSSISLEAHSQRLLAPRQILNDYKVVGGHHNSTRRSLVLCSWGRSAAYHSHLSALCYQARAELETCPHIPAVKRGHLTEARPQPGSEHPAWSLWGQWQFGTWHPQGWGRETIEAQVMVQTESILDFVPTLCLSTGEGSVSLVTTDQVACSDMKDRDIIP